MRRGPRLARIALGLGALAGLAPAAKACPSCALSQGLDTLVYIGMFLLVPYVIVSGTWLWIRRILGSEHEGTP